MKLLLILLFQWLYICPSITQSHAAPKSLHENANQDYETNDDIMRLLTKREANNNNEGCGIVYEHFKASSRVANGREAPSHSWPWVILLMYYDYENTGRELRHAGASLVSHWHAISSAHVFYDGSTFSWSRISAYAGKHTVSGTERYQKLLQIRNVTHLPTFDRTQEEDDLAIITFAKKVEFTYAIRPICLPNKPVEEGSAAYVVGWGDTIQTGDYNRLQEISIKVRPIYQCIELYKIRKFGDVDPDAICAGGTFFADTCLGDSGGPLMTEEDGKWYLHGITSYGAGCGLGWPAIYTNIYRNMDFIRNMVTTG